MKKILILCCVFWLNLAVAETGTLSIEVNPFGTASSSVPFSDDDTGWTDKGHAWLRYISDDGWEVTLGTWGNMKPIGLYVNKEKYYPAQVSRSTKINNSQFDILLSKFREYNNDKSWTIWNNCSKFASDTWNSIVKNDFLDNRYPLPADNIWNAPTGRWPTPTSLFYAIINANNGSSHSTVNENQDINALMKKYSSYFGGKSGSNYSCFSSNYTCQDFTNGNKIAYRNSDGYLYYFSVNSWYKYGYID